ncbi:MAG: Gfo/Idh/MocA family oxidoreductase [Bacteroidota bacterium]
MMESSRPEKPNRRTFIKSTGAAVIGGTTALNLGFPRPASGRANDTLKVGLIGCGGRGTGAASQALHADPDVMLTAMADAFSDRLEQSYENLLKVHPEKVKVASENKYVGFDAYQKVIESDVDVVILATPPGFRPDHLAAAVDAGKHVFCEKPMAVDAPGVRKVMAAIRKTKENNLALVSGFTYRYDNPRRALFSRVQDGAIGEIKTVSTTRNGGTLWYKERQPEWSQMEYQLRNWYYYNWLSGDFIVEMIVHSLDMMSWALGDKVPLRATGTGGRQARVDEKWGNIYDHFAVEYEYEDEIRGMNFCRQQANCSNRNTVEIAGTEGNAYVGRNGFKITGKNSWQYEGEENDPYQTQHDELFASIRAGKPKNDGDFMANSTMMAILGRMATYSGQTLSWDEALNSSHVLGPPVDQYSWNLDWPGPGVAVPGITKVL